MNIYKFGFLLFLLKLGPWILVFRRKTQCGHWRRLMRKNSQSHQMASKKSLNTLKIHPSYRPLAKRSDLEIIPNTIHCANHWTRLLAAAIRTAITTTSNWNCRFRSVEQIKNDNNIFSYYTKRSRLCSFVPTHTVEPCIWLLKIITKNSLVQMGCLYWKIQILRKKTEKDS